MPLHADAADDTICCYTKDICSIYPKDQLLVDMKIEAYLGAPLHDSNNNVMGIIVALYKEPITNEREVLTLFQVFSGRIAAELERREYESLLEEKVEERTKELSTTLAQLKLTQKQLIESEKMAALGGLVVGISHEVNTPLGIAITTQSIMADEMKALNTKVKNDSLSLRAFSSYQTKVENALGIQKQNLNHAQVLIDNFKKIAADQHHLEIKKINIGEYYQEVSSTLHSLLVPLKISLKIHCATNIYLATYPGAHAQILTTLITNSVRHAFSFPKRNDSLNIINIDISENPEKEVIVIYQDNGKGLSKEARKHVFEPFYTTDRSQGGIGLGMPIIFNLINQKLNGKIEYVSTDRGACFRYKFKEISSIA